MISIARPLYTIPTNCAVKWLATQERHLNKELPYTDSATETPEEYVSRTYLQFLWLPQSIMQLQFLIPALLRVEHASPSLPSTSQAPPSHPLHTLLQPILLTSRASSQKYHGRISQLLAEEHEPDDQEEEYMWYAYQKDKTVDVEVQEGQDEYDLYERLKKAWLERMERREVQIQILLHFLLLSLPRTGAIPSADKLSDPSAYFQLLPQLSPSKSKKRKRRDREKDQAPPPPPQPLEERLESYMDKLAMWQLMQSVDSTLGLGHADSAKSAANGLDQGKQKDDRDWMQAFCEDVVEPLFKDKLPELCALFHSKLFPDTANSDTDTLDLSPPASPKPATKRLKSATSAASTSSAAGAKAKTNAAQRARSRSLSVSLEQEQRERSRSVSIGPGGLRKRAIVREISMSTVFKGKERAKSKAELSRTGSVSAPGPSLSRSQSQSQSQSQTQTHRAPQQLPDTRNAEKSAQGNVLVAATPVKARTLQSQSQLSEAQARLPALFSTGSQSQTLSQSARTDDLEISSVVDGDTFITPTKARRKRDPSRVLHDTDDEGGSPEWKLKSSPEELPLGAPGVQDWSTPNVDGPPLSSSPGDLGGFGSSDKAEYAERPQGRILVGDTPTKEG
ncbi:DNA replication regulator SLD3-domain-containing protein [Cubamyces lactineus]|nr:DNA replication regulator SLD3-domain-containing protein [Cubamyces lactineus]